MIANPYETNLAHLGAVPVSYEPKKINTIAIQATPENIGALSVEVESELFYDASRPYFGMRVERESGDRALTVRLGDWLVVLWDSYYVFRDREFINTFEVHPFHTADIEDPKADQPALHELREKMKEYEKPTEHESFDAPYESPLQAHLTETTQIVPKFGHLDESPEWKITPSPSRRRVEPYQGEDVVPGPLATPGPDGVVGA